MTKAEAQAELAAIQEKAEQLKQFLDTSDEPELPYPWKPEKGEHYWYVNADGNIVQSIWTDGPIDRQRLSTHNVFRTYKDADFAVEHLPTFFRSMQEKINQKQWLKTLGKDDVAEFWRVYVDGDVLHALANPLHADRPYPTKDGAKAIGALMKLFLLEG